MLSKAASSTIFWIFGMTWPGIELRSPGPLANTLLIRPMAWSLKGLFYGFIWLPTKSDLTWSHFIVRRPCTNWDPCMAITKNFWPCWQSPFGVSQVPSNKLSFVIQVLLVGKASHWGQAINFYPSGANTRYVVKCQASCCMSESFTHFSLPSV